MRLIIALLVALPVFAQNGQSPFDIAYPSDAGVLNVKTTVGCGAVGNGVADDTTAIQNCIYKAANEVSPGVHHSIIYFPSGTYLVSSTLLWQGSPGTWFAHIQFQGQNSNTTTIKLTSGKYTSTSCQPLYAGTGTMCPAVIQTANSGNFEFGENGYQNDVRDLTIDTTGNAGAIAIAWQCSNEGILRNVIIQGGGMVGIGQFGVGGSGPGPCMMENVSVASGYQYDFAITALEVSVTMEHIDLTGATIAAVANVSNNIAARDLEITTSGSVPAVINSTNGNFAVISSTWTGSGAATAALLNSGFVYARAITTSGYTSAINGVPGANVSEYVSFGVTTLFTGSASTSLGLAINETPPLINDNNFSNWANVETFGAACGSGDSTTAIQNALNSGHSTVYFPQACIYTFGTINVPTGVTRVLGFYSSLHGTLINLNGTSGSYVEFRQFGVDQMISMNVHNNQTVPLVMRDIQASGALVYDSVGSNGKTLYMDNFDSDGQVNIESGVSAWGRQVDIEAAGQPYLYNHGGTLWVLGFKTEGASDTGTGIIYATGGQTEVIGVFNSTFPTNTAMKSVNASISVAGASMADPSTMISETRSSTTHSLAPNGARSNDYIGLWIGWTGGPPPANCSGGGPGSGATCVQFTRGFDQTGSSFSTIAATYPASLTATNLLVVSCMYFNTASQPVINLPTDSLSQTYTATAQVTSGSFSMRTFYIPSSASGADTATCNFASAVTYPAVLIQEYSGLAKSSPLDVSATNSGTGTTATGGNVTTTVPDMLYGVYYGTESLASVPIGWFIRNAGSPDSDGSADITEVSTGTYTSSFTMSSSGNWVAGTLAFKIAAGTTTLSQAIVVF